MEKLLETPIWLWVGFNVFVLAMLALDLGVFHRKAHEVKMREALAWSGVWIGLGLLFNLGVYWLQGSRAALEFFTGYVIEKSLSVDNVFVFLMIFSYFKVPAAYQHRVLFWGIIGALAMRAVFIVGGVALLQNFHWLIYVFGGLLVLAGIKMAIQHNRATDPEGNPVIRFFKRLVPVTKEYHGDRFFVRQAGRVIATPLVVVLLVVETTDVIFAVDSIPAILAITDNAFIVYTSNVFAMLGLRALYFAMAGLMGLFRFLHYGLAAVLVFVGAKMLMADVYKLPVAVSLGIVMGILAMSVFVSLIMRPAHRTATTDRTDAAAAVGA